MHFDVGYSKYYIDKYIENGVRQKCSLWTAIFLLIFEEKWRHLNFFCNQVDCNKDSTLQPSNTAEIFCTIESVFLKVSIIQSGYSVQCVLKHIKLALCRISFSAQHGLLVPLQSNNVHRASWEKCICTKYDLWSIEVWKKK